MAMTNQEKNAEIQRLLQNPEFKEIFEKITNEARERDKKERREKYPTIEEYVNSFSSSLNNENRRSDE
jgi:cation transport regulator ChaB